MRLNAALEIASIVVWWSRAYFSFVVAFQDMKGSFEDDLARTFLE
jgi:hypothetical protein